MAALRTKIQHVIYIIKENRTYDQILGDREVGNGDPDLTEFGQATTPNLHSLARTFVTLDNFYDRSEVSMDGWPWSVSARSPDVVEKQVTVNYGGRGLSNDSEGTNRNINVSLPTLAERLQADPVTPNDPDLLPGTADTSAPDGPDNEINTGYIWDAALRAGLSIRNYGFFIDGVRYNTPAALSQVSLPFSSGDSARVHTASSPMRPRKCLVAERPTYQGIPAEAGTGMVCFVSATRFPLTQSASCFPSAVTTTKLHACIGKASGASSNVFAFWKSPNTGRPSSR